MERWAYFVKCQTLSWSWEERWGDRSMDAKGQRESALDTKVKWESVQTERRDVEAS